MDVSSSWPMARPSTAPCEPPTAAAGTEVIFDGRVIARLNQPGWARELRRFAAYQQSDVFIAVDDAVAVRGLVSVNALQPATP